MIRPRPPVIPLKIGPCRPIVGATLVVARLRSAHIFIPGGEGEAVMKYSERSEEPKIHNRKTRQPVPRLYRDQE